MNLLSALESIVSSKIVALTKLARLLDNYNDRLNILNETYPHKGPEYQTHLATLNIEFHEALNGKRNLLSFHKTTEAET